MELESLVQNEQILGNVPPAASHPSDGESTSPAPDVGAISASHDAIGRSEAEAIDTVVVQLGSIGRLGMTYVLASTDDSRQFYRIAGQYSYTPQHVHL